LLVGYYSIDLLVIVVVYGDYALCGTILGRICMKSTGNVRILTNKGTTSFKYGTEKKISYNGSDLLTDPLSDYQNETWKNAEDKRCVLV
jgi:hypothetical protein